jgi:hypothetical protein
MTNDPIQAYREFDENDPAYQVRILALRVDALTKEKEELEKSEAALEARVENIERSLGKGAGILIGLATVGTIGGVLMAWGKTIFAPWIKS